MAGKALLGQLSDLDIRLLRVFRAIVESGGMSAAELELNISRSAISRHLKDLEIRLGGLTLCRRGRAGFALTEDGRQIYEATLRLETAMDDFRAQVNDLHQEMTGNLIVAMGDCTATNPEAHIAPALEMFGRQAPQVTLEMHVESVNAIEPRIMDGTYHVGIVPLHRESSSLDYLPLFGETMFLYSAPSHPINQVPHSELTWADVREYDYAGLGYHSPNMELARKVELKRAATAFHQEAIVTLIESGRYLGFLPGHYAQPFEAKERIIRVANESFKYEVTYSAIVKSAPEPSRSAKTMIRCLERAHKQVAEDGGRRDPIDDSRVMLT